MIKHSRWKGCEGVGVKRKNGVKVKLKKGYMILFMKKEVSFVISRETKLLSPLKRPEGMKVR